MSHTLKLTSCLIVAIVLLAAGRPLLRAQTACDPSISPPNADNSFSLPSSVFEGEPFYEDVHICGVPGGTSIRVKVAFVSATTGLTVFSNLAPTDINGVAPVEVPSGLPADQYNLTFSSPDAPGLTTGPGSGLVNVLKGGALSAMNGMYIFLFQAVSASGVPAGAPKQTHILGSFIADGKGNITGGEADINSPLGVEEKVQITGSYTLDYTGRGTLSLASSLGALRFSVSFGGTQREGAPGGYESGAFTSAAGSALIGTGTLKFVDPGFQAGPLYSNTIIRLQGESACDATCLATGGFAAPFAVSGSLCLGCLPPSAADGPELYRAVFNLVAGNSTKWGMVQTGSLGATDGFARSVMSAATGSATGMPQRYAVYAVDSADEYLLSLDPHNRAALVSGKVIAGNENYH
jgi:hypothetical protein